MSVEREVWELNISSAFDCSWMKTKLRLTLRLCFLENVWGKECGSSRSKSLNFKGQGNGDKDTCVNSYRESGFLTALELLSWETAC